jgi:hypothetical protein
MTWPFDVCPDWPINDDWLHFAFAPVEFTLREGEDVDTTYTKEMLLRPFLTDDRKDSHKH